MKLKEMWQGLISAFKAKEAVDIRIPTQAETDLWVANRQVEYMRQQQQRVVDRKERTLPDLKKDIADMFLRTGRCTLFLYYDSYHEYHLCAEENWDDIVSWAEKQGVVLEMSGEYTNAADNSLYRILTGKRVIE